MKWPVRVQTSHAGEHENVYILIHHIILVIFLVELYNASLQITTAANVIMNSLKQINIANKSKYKESYHTQSHDPHAKMD